jgi:GNAT superfamily N-acetyltransferase
VIRELRDGDLGAIARIWRELRPDAMHSERGLAHLLSSFPERAQRGCWVAEDDGVVGWCLAHRRWHRATGNGYIWLGVLPQARGRGLGTALYAAAERHFDAIGVARVNADAVGDEAGARFLDERGFVHIRTVVVSAVDPRAILSAELSERRVDAERDGYRLVPYAAVEMEALYTLELGLSADEPGEDEPRLLSFDEWRAELFEDPDLTLEGSFGMVADKTPVAYSTLAVDPATRRGRNEGTATARAHRGRGLATLAKLGQLQWAAQNGIERVVTDNDERNAPMLAINRRLGYTPFTERRGYLKELTAPAGTAAAPARAAPAP